MVSRCLLKLRMMEVVVITGAISHAKPQSNYHRQETNTQFFTVPARHSQGLPLPGSATPTVGHWVRVRVRVRDRVRVKDRVSVRVRVVVRVRRTVGVADRNPLTLPYPNPNPDQIPGMAGRYRTGN